MRLLYSFGIHCYFVLIWIMQFFNPKAKKWITGRKNVFNDLKKSIDTTNLYWFHCASLGEFDQGIPVMNALKKRDPAAFILVTFFSPSGMEHYHKRRHCANYVCYLPIDTPKNAKKFLSITQPKKIFFIKYEFWFNYIFEAKKSEIPLYSISCILRPDQLFFKKYGSFFREGLSYFTYFFVQNNETKLLLNQIHLTNALITGDTRFDKVIDNKNNSSEDTIIENFLSTSKKAIILGSSWAWEEELLKEIIHQLPNEKIIIAPHDVSEKHINAIESLFDNAIRYSNMSKEIQYSSNVLIIDCIGKLSNAYRYGKMAFIGGGSTGKLHNILEPAVFGLPVIFGPKHSKFPEAKQFLDVGIGYEISNSNELSGSINFIDNNLNTLTLKCATFIESSTGASEKIIENIF